MSDDGARIGCWCQVAFEKNIFSIFIDWKQKHRNVQSGNHLRHIIKAKIACIKLNVYDFVSCASYLVVTTSA